MAKLIKCVRCSSRSSLHVSLPPSAPRSRKLFSSGEHYRTPPNALVTSTVYFYAQGTSRLRRHNLKGRSISQSPPCRLSVCMRSIQWQLSRSATYELYVRIQKYIFNTRNSQFTFLFFNKNICIKPNITLFISHDVPKTLLLISTPNKRKSTLVSDCECNKKWSEIRTVNRRPSQASFDPHFVSEWQYYPQHISIALVCFSFFIACFCLRYTVCLCGSKSAVVQI